MKKLMVLSVLGISLMAQASHVIRVQGYGKGGSTVGDRRAACGRAYERADDDAYFNCRHRNGYVQYVQENHCGCRVKSGTRDDLVCEATVTAGCEVRYR